MTDGHLYRILSWIIKRLSLAPTKVGSWHALFVLLNRWSSAGFYVQRGQQALDVGPWQTQLLKPQTAPGGRCSDYLKLPAELARQSLDELQP
jgi:hypothetical protein